MATVVATRPCKRKGCELTALWQVGLNFCPRWAPDAEPIKAWTGLLVCGMCAEQVKVEDFGDLAPNFIRSLGRAYAGGEPDAFRAEIRLDDISDGRWTSPDRPGKRVSL